MNGHPTVTDVSDEEFLTLLESWANCSVPDCENKVTHESDKCFRHPYGYAY